MIITSVDGKVYTVAVRPNEEVVLMSEDGHSLKVSKDLPGSPTDKALGVGQQLRVQEVE